MRKTRVNSRANIEHGARRSARHSPRTARIKHLSINISFTKSVPPRPRFLLLSRYLLPWFRRRSFLSLRVTQCGVLRRRMVLFFGGDFGAKKIRHTRNALYLIKLFVRPLFAARKHVTTYRWSWISRKAGINLPRKRSRWRAFFSFSVIMSKFSLSLSLSFF